MKTLSTNWFLPHKTPQAFCSSTLPSRDTEMGGMLDKEFRSSLQLPQNLKESSKQTDETQKSIWVRNSTTLITNAELDSKRKTPSRTGLTNANVGRSKHSQLRKTANLYKKKTKKKSVQPFNSHLDVKTSICQLQMLEPARCFHKQGEACSLPARNSPTGKDSHSWKDGRWHGQRTATVNRTKPKAGDDAMHL